MLNVFSKPHQATIHHSPFFGKTFSLAIALCLSFALTACQDESKKKSYQTFGPEAWDEPSADSELTDSSGKSFEVGYLKNGSSAPRQGKFEADLAASSWVVRTHPAPNPIQSVRPGNSATEDGAELIADQKEETPVKYEYFYQGGAAIAASALNLDQPYCVLNDIPASFTGTAANAAVEELFLPKQIVVNNREELTLELNSSQYRFFVVCQNLKLQDQADSEKDENFAQLAEIFGEALLISKASSE